MWRNDQKDVFIEKLFDTTKSVVIIFDSKNLTFVYENYTICIVKLNAYDQFNVILLPTKKDIYCLRKQLKCKMYSYAS